MNADRPALLWAATVRQEYSSFDDYIDGLPLFFVTTPIEELENNVRFSSDTIASSA